MFNPFFDPTKLSQQELEDKINELSLRISAARSAGISYDIIQSMFAVISACDEEIQLRLAKAELDESENNDKCIFDLENYLDNDTKEPNKNDRTRKQKYKRKW